MSNQEKIHELEEKYRNLLKERDQSTGAARYLAEKELTATRKMILKLEGQSIAEEVKGQIPELVRAAVADVVEQIAGIKKQIKANADGNHSEEHAESGLNANAANIPDPSSYFSSDIDQRIKDYFEPELPQHIKDVIDPPLPENIAAYFGQPKEVGGVDLESYFAPGDRYQVSKD